jgi:5,10-methylene-tetrahydrofolate dehydrogenase/methenyl tetrahydrofolate cyclohydrolase
MYLDYLITGKTKIMNLLFTIMALLLIDVQNKEWKIIYLHYKNESGKNITINSFRIHIQKRLSPIITQLNNGQSITKTFEDTFTSIRYDFAV